MGALAITQALGFGLIGPLPIIQSLTPWLLLPAFPIAVVAAWKQRRALALTAAGIAVALLVLSAPIAFPGGRPDVSPDAARFSVAFANVYRNNSSPARGRGGAGARRRRARRGGAEPGDGRAAGGARRRRTATLTGWSGRTGRRRVWPSTHGSRSRSARSGASARASDSRRDARCRRRARPLPRGAPLPAGVGREDEPGVGGQPRRHRRRRHHPRTTDRRRGRLQRLALAPAVPRPAGSWPARRPRVDGPTGSRRRGPSRGTSRRSSGWITPSSARAWSPPRCASSTCRAATTAASWPTSPSTGGRPERLHERPERPAALRQGVLLGVGHLREGATVTVRRARRAGRSRSRRSPARRGRSRPR